MRRYYQHRKSPRRRLYVSHQRVAEMPPVFQSISDLACHFGLSNSTVYRWLDSTPPLPVKATVVNKNTNYRIPREPFRRWLIATQRYNPKK